MFCEQRLIGRDDMLLGCERSFDRLARRPLVAADQFDEDVDGAVDGELRRIVEPLVGAEIDAAALRPVTGRYSRYLELAAQALGEARAVRLEEVEQTGTDGAQAGHSQSQRFIHGVDFIAWRYREWE